MSPERTPRMTADLDPAAGGPLVTLPLQRAVAAYRGTVDQRLAGAVDAPLRASPRALVARRSYSDIEVYLDENDRAFWCFLNPQARPSFTLPLLADLADMNRLIASLFAATPADAPTPFDYFVFASRSPGVFSLGGDLTFFADRIRTGDRDGLREYVQSCVTTSYANYTGYGHGVVSIALIQGDALGGGLEAPLSCDLIIAERQAKFGMPDILFNMFPGVGAYSFLSRRIGPAKTEEIILSGRIYTAAEMHALGVVDVLVDEGTGEQAVHEHIARYRSRFRARSAICAVRRRARPVPIEELRDIADLWVDTALRMTEQDLRKMSRIASAQDRANARSNDRKVALAR
jgi:DSF synthase